MIFLLNFDRCWQFNEQYSFIHRPVLSLIYFSTSPMYDFKKSSCNKKENKRFRNYYSEQIER